MAAHRTVRALGLGWQVQLAESAVRAVVSREVRRAYREIDQLAAVARIELVHNVRVTFGRQS